jgi:SAM-dependent methyltransferase
MNPADFPHDAPERSAALYDELAPDYDRQVSGNDGVRVRAAFYDFVTKRIPISTPLLDFGCGTGIDAAFFAARGHRVLAYDNSPGMVDVLRRRCGGEIASGRIEAWSCPYAEFRASLGDRSEVGAITANFAVINVVPDLRAWFDAAAEHLAPGGRVFLSALNPCALEQWRRVSYWHKAWAHRRAPGIPYVGKELGHVRYWPWRLADQAPAFRLLSQAGAGILIRWARPPGALGHALGERFKRWTSSRWPGKLLGQFTFFELEKRDV